MKTTIDIPDDLLRDVVKYTKASSKKDAVVTAMRDFIRQRQLAEVADLLGTFNDFMTFDELMDMRHERGAYAVKKSGDDRHGKLDRVSPRKRSA